MKPDEETRKKIDALLEAAGWLIQTFEDLNLGAGVGVTVREFPLKGAGFADYMLFAERHAVGVVEAKPIGTTLSGVSEQTELVGKKAQ
jgi:type I restriction enzyme R subunit